MTPAVIDLGEIPLGGRQPGGRREDGGQPAGRVRGRAARGRAVRRYTRIWIFPLVLVAALGLAGAARPRSPLPEIGSVDYRAGEAFQLAGDRLYVVYRSTDASVRVVAYRLASGREVWRTGLPSRVRRLVAAPRAGVLLAIADADSSVTALDSQTGRVRWQLPDRLVGDLAPDGRTGLAWSRDSSRLASVDLATGRPTWTWSVPPGLPAQTLSTVDAAGRWLVVVRSLDGRTHVLDGRTGAVRAAGILAAPPADAPTNPGPAVLGAAGDLLSLRYRSLAWGVVDGYDLATLRPRWHLSLASSLPYLDDCGTLVCVGGARDGLFAVDPGTGRVVWADGRRNQATRLTAGPPGRLLAYQTPLVSELAPQQLAVLDAATGRPLADLGDGWWPESGPDTRRVLLARPGRNTTSTFVVLDLATLVRQPLGRLPIAPFACQAGARLLVCPTPGDLLGIWRYGR